MLEVPPRDRTQNPRVRVQRHLLIQAFWRGDLGFALRRPGGSGGALVCGKEAAEDRISPAPETNRWHHRARDLRSCVCPEIITTTGARLLFCPDIRLLSSDHDVCPPPRVYRLELVYGGWCDDEHEIDVGSR
jgi:hypothetical protein